MRRAAMLQVLFFLEAHGFAASARIHDVWIPELESRLDQRGFVVDLCSEKKHLSHRLDYDPCAVLLDDLVIFVDGIDEVHDVFHSCASALLYANSQPFFARISHELRYVPNGGVSQSDCLLSRYSEH